eukprot:893965-Pelagomonas_calceolata.AAC.2
MVTCVHVEESATVHPLTTCSGCYYLLLHNGAGKSTGAVYTEGVMRACFAVSLHSTETGLGGQAGHEQKTYSALTKKDKKGTEKATRKTAPAREGSVHYGKVP